jgi:hypothetical protein
MIDSIIIDLVIKKSSSSIIVRKGIGKSSLKNEKKEPKESVSRKPHAHPINEMRSNEKYIADPYIKNVFLTIDDDSRGSFLENEEGKIETKFSRYNLDKMKIEKNKRSKKIEQKTPKLEEYNKYLDKGYLEPQIFIPIEEDEHASPENFIEEQVI